MAAYWDDGRLEPRTSALVVTKEQYARMFTDDERGMISVHEVGTNQLYIDVRSDEEDALVWKAGCRIGLFGSCVY